MEKSECFDATCASETLKSPIKTSTVARGSGKWDENVFFKRNQNLQASSSMFHVHSPITVLSEVTNISKDKVKNPVYQLNDTSYESDGSSSSLGILHVENLSDFSDNSCFDATRNHSQTKYKGSPRKKTIPYKDHKFKDDCDRIFRETLEAWDDSEKQNDSSSSSDIEFDGTNIPELNLDFDVLSLNDCKKDISTKNCVKDESEDTDALKLSNKEIIDSEYSTISSQFSCESEDTDTLKLSSKEIIDSEYSTTSSQFSRSNLSDTDTTARESIGSDQHSIFKNFQPCYESLHKQLRFDSEDDKIEKDSKKIKVCPFLDVSSFEVEPILQQQHNSDISTNIENARCSENISVDFCPEHISARSSSFKSSLALESKSSEFSSFNHQDFNDKSSSGSEQFPEDLKNEVLSGGSCCPAPESKICFGDSENNFVLSSTHMCDLSKSKSQMSENQSLASFSNAEFSFQGMRSSFPAQEDWCNRLGIPDSEFFSAEAGKEILMQDEIKEQMFESQISSKLERSKWSPVSQHETTAIITAKSGELGKLSDDSKRERPYFGLNATTPTKKNKLNIGGDDPKYRVRLVSDIMDSSTFAESPETTVNLSNVLNSGNRITTTADLQNDISKVHAIDEDLQSTLAQYLPDNNLCRETDFHNKNESKLSHKCTHSVDTTLNISTVDSNSDRESIKTEKCETCVNGNVSPSEQNCVHAFSRSTSSCSSSCHNPVALRNVYSLQNTCMNYLKAVPDPGQCMVPNNYLLFSSGASDTCSHVCPQHSIHSNIQQPAVVLPCISITGPPTGIQAPSRLCYPEKIAIGDSQEMNLAIQNAGSSACIYQISCHSAYLNNLPLSIEMTGLTFPKTVPSTSNSSTDIKLVLAPKYEGKFEVNLQIDGITHAVNVPGMTAKTKIEFETVLPSVSLQSKYRDSFNLGSVISGSTFVEYVSVVNNCEVSVPLRITLSNDSFENQIYFGLKEIARQKYLSFGKPIFLSPKVMLYRLPGTKNKSLPSRLDLPIIFESVKGQISSTLTAAVETPTLREVLDFVKISATAGNSKLILKDTSQNPVKLKTSKGSTTSSSLTVINDGDIPVVYDLQIESEYGCFDISPNSLNLQPQQSAVITITYSSLTLQATKGKLLAAAQPHGQVCVVLDVFGEVFENFYPCISSIPKGYALKPNRKSMEIKPQSSNVIECNKKYLAWSGINVGESNVKTFILRNKGNETVETKLFSKEKSQAFQLIDDMGQKTSSLIYKLGAKEYKEISVAFNATSVAVYSSLLCIKPTVGNARSVYSIPLSGYGGVAKIKVLGLTDGDGTGYFLKIDFPPDSETVYKNITVHNTGSRAAFVKFVVNYNNLVQNQAQHRTVIHPSEFVLLENEKKNILFCMNAANKSLASNDEIISILYGDEILRQRLKRKYNTSGMGSPNNSYNINFCVPYDGENRIPHESSYSCSEKDYYLFYASIKKVLVHLVFNMQGSNFSSMDFTTLSMIEDSFSNLTLNSSSARRLTIEGHSPPVKDSAIRSINRFSLPIPCEDNMLKTALKNTSSLVNGFKNLDLQTWTVTPEELVLDAENKDNRILLKNFSTSDMRFKVEWTIDVITVSPVSGIVAAKGEIGLRLSLINNNHNKLIQNYQGTIKITCDGTEKIIHVNIQKKGRLSNFLQPTQQFLNMSLKSGFLGDSLYMDNTIEDSIREIIHIESISCFPKQIDLPKTKQGTSTELVLNIGNPLKNSVSWNIHPTSMAFTEPFDDSVDWSSPTIEILSPMGSMKPGETAILTIKFSPSSVASFSQYFEITTTIESGGKENRSFKVQGEGVSNSESLIPDTNDKKKYSKSQKIRSELFLEKEIYEFKSVAPGQKSTENVVIKNTTAQDYKLSIRKPQPPFYLNFSSLTIKATKFLKVPASFKPPKLGSYESEVKFISENGIELKVLFKGCCT